MEVSRFFITQYISIREAIRQLDDSNIYIHFFKYKNSDGHPNVAEQNMMANSLIQFIESKVKW